MTAEDADYATDKAAFMGRLGDDSNPEYLIAQDLETSMNPIDIHASRKDVQKLYE